MANVEIIELTALTNPASSDVLPIVDVGADETKKVTIADLLENAGSGNASAAAFAFDGDADTGMYRTGANALGFTTGGTGRLFIDSSGNVGIGTPSPAVACDVVGQVRASTGILFGSDTAAANALDDYEEGAWTPGIAAETGSFTALTVDNVRSIYTKVGNVVTIQCFIRTDNYDETGASGNLIITGLPYAGKAGQTRSIGSTLLMEYNSESSFTGTFAAFLGASTEATFVRVDQGANSGAANKLQVDQLQTSADDNRNWMSFTLTYLTD